MPKRCEPGCSCAHRQSNQIQGEIFLPLRTVTNPLRGPNAHSDPLHGVSQPAGGAPKAQVTPQPCPSL